MNVRRQPLRPDDGLPCTGTRRPLGVVRRKEFVLLVERDRAGNETVASALRSEIHTGRNVIAGDEEILEVVQSRCVRRLTLATRAGECNEREANRQARPPRPVSFCRVIRPCCLWAHISSPLRMSKRLKGGAAEEGAEKGCAT